MIDHAFPGKHFGAAFLQTFYFFLRFLPPSCFRAPLKRLFRKQGYAPALEREPAVDIRQSPSSNSPGSPAEVSTDKSLICLTWGVCAALSGTHSAPRCSSSVTQHVIFQRQVGRGLHRIRSNSILPRVVIWFRYFN